MSSVSPELLEQIKAAVDGELVAYDIFLATGIVDGVPQGNQTKLTIVRDKKTCDIFLLEDLTTGRTHEETGWFGLVCHLRSIQLADIIVYLTSMLKTAHPDEPEKWVWRLGNIRVRRVPEGGCYQVVTPDFTPLPPNQKEPLPLVFKPGI